MTHEPTPNLGFFAGIAYPLRGARFVYLEHRGLARLWGPPLAIVAVLLGVVTWLAISHHASLFEAIWPSPEGATLGAQALRGLHWLLSSLFGLALSLAGAAFVLLANSVIAAPWNDALSAAVERIVGRAPAASSTAPRFVRDALRSASFAALLLTAYLAIMAALLLLAWAIPVAGVLIQTGVGSFITALFLAIEHADLSAARHGLSVSARFAHTRRHLRSALGMGIAIWALMVIPLLNLLLAPAAVAGATLWFLDTHAIERQGGLGARAP